eukprot:TRINITY_DN10289_c0_g3_i1.p1 TRINITY_DN10289_c0_g3~~TRINITY_DN10289_c0_g3_i1.p1  ORF type:complete len:106 (+),score=0.99 TRINITY_DN10289_c0_g3_i1:168-485(+)
MSWKNGLRCCGEEQYGVVYKRAVSKVFYPNVLVKSDFSKADQALCLPHSSSHLVQVEQLHKAFHHALVVAVVEAQILLEQMQILAARPTFLPQLLCQDVMSDDKR